MEIQQAMSALKEIERHANGSKMTGMYNDASGYFKNLFFKIAEEARQKQWIDEDIYAIITGFNSDSDNSVTELTVLGCASTVFMRFLGDAQGKAKSKNPGRTGQENAWGNSAKHGLNHRIVHGQAHNFDFHLDELVDEINSISDGLRELTEEITSNFKRFSNNFKDELMDDVADEITSKVINALKDLPKGD